MTRPRYNNKKKRKRKSKFKSGVYIVENIEKYRQPQDKTMNAQIYPTYRSSWEEKFMFYLDHSNNIEFWGSEPLAIKYISPKDGQIHRYYIDFMFKTVSGEKHLIEIKPKSQFNNPINQAKWKAAQEYANQIGAIFSVVSEVELKKWGLI